MPRCVRDLRVHRQRAAGSVGRHPGGERRSGQRPDAAAELGFGRELAPAELLVPLDPRQVVGGLVEREHLDAEDAARRIDGDHHRLGERAHPVGIEVGGAAGLAAALPFRGAGPSLEPSRTIGMDDRGGELGAGELAGGGGFRRSEVDRLPFDGAAGEGERQRLFGGEQHPRRRRRRRQGQRQGRNCEP